MMLSSKRIAAAGLFSCIWMTLMASNAVLAFAPSSSVSKRTTALGMAQSENDLLRWARQSRSASSDDNVVELMRPLGLVLNQDDNNNVYVETVAPKGNAARTGKVGLFCSSRDGILT